MAFWSSYFHRSDADDSLAKTLREIREKVVAMQVVLGNETTENSLVHDVNVLKSDVEMDKEQDRQLVSRMDSVKTAFFFFFFFFFASDQLKEEVETVRKMKGPKGEQGDRRPKGDRGDRGPQGERGLNGEMGEEGPSDPFHLLPYIAQNAYYYVHPSRFQSIERTSKDNYGIRNLVDFTGKTISTEKLMMTKDNQQRFYLALGKKTEACRSGTKWTTFLKTTKRLPYFKSVKQTTSLLQTSLLHLCISDLALHSPDLVGMPCISTLPT